MSFAERTKNPPPPRNLCPVGRVLHQLDAAERAELESMLADTEHWPTSGAGSIQEAIDEEGHGRLNEKAIRIHRATDCRCVRS